jgi:glycosyltransferase involved in cell wall biosynthesis
MSSNRPQVVLLANLHFYTHGAIALQRVGWLRRYIFAIGPTRRNRVLFRLLPSRYRQKFQTRDLSLLADQHVISLWLPELLQRGLPALGVMSASRGNWLGAHLFDWEASPYVAGCDLFHFVNGVGLHSAQRAKKQGSRVICDMRAEHPDFQHGLLQVEYAQLGLKYDHPFSLVRDRLCEEYAVADYFIVPSSYARDTYVQFGIDPARMFVVPYGVDFEHFDRLPTADPGWAATSLHDGFRIIYVGQLCVRKGIHYLIEAFRALPRPDKELLLVGGFSESHYQAYLEKLVGDDPRIQFVGQVPKTSLINYYQQSSVFVLPSLADSFGLVTLEAMACGLPVIVTENSGSSEVVRSGVNGYVVPIRDVAALTEKLNLLASNPDLRRQMGLAAYAQARQFTWDRYAAQLLEVYAAIFNARSGKVVG